MRLVITAIVLLVAYVALGAVVSPRPPLGIDEAALALVGQDVPAALVFTRIGLFDVYAVLCAALIVFGFIRREWLGRVAIAVVALLVAWKVSDVCKDAFHRPRPEHWFGTHETSFSYSSGHATLSLTFYGLWACYLLASDLPRPARITIATILFALIAAIGWSRLALGAHYLTDVIGGYLLGGTVLCLALAVNDRVSRTGRMARNL